MARILQRLRIRRNRARLRLCLDCGRPLLPRGLSVICWSACSPQYDTITR